MLNGQHKKRVKPRNFVVLAMIEAGLTKAGGHGAHTKTRKAERRGEKINLQKELCHD